MEPSAATTAPEATEASSNGHAQSAETFDVHRPTDGSVIQSVAIDSPERVAEVVSRVRSNQGEWEAMGFAERRRWLERWRDWMLSNREHIADVVQEETGKVRGDSGLESIYLEMAINFWGRTARSTSPTRRPAPASSPAR